MPAYYKYIQLLTKSDNAAFDEIHEPGETTPHSGIYVCVNCGKEATSVLGHPLPPQNHHQHSQSQGRIRWKLAVWG